MALNTISGTSAADNLAGTANADLMTGFAQYGATSNIGLTRVASGLTQPIFVTAPPDDTGLLFIAEKAGTIKIIDLATNTRLATPFLDLTGTLRTNSEQGLLGLAFDPDYASNGTFYVFVSNLSGDSEIRRYKADPANPNIAATEFELVLRIDTPDNLSNHRAGWIGFGSDGMLYAAVGDGGGGGDPGNNGQNTNTLLGKILRLDVNGADAFPQDATRSYAIPADNPFVGTAGADEIYAYGLRNPWRNSFDRGTDDLYIADVGQGVWEEVNLGSKGANYGWKLYEGPATYPGGVVGTPAAGITAPFHSYNHSLGDASVTGGYVYRGPQEGLFGSYIFGDYVSGRVWSLSDPDGDGAWTRIDLTAALNVGGSIGNVASFGEDAEGRLYLVDFDGEVFRIDPVASTPDSSADTLSGGDGDDNIFGGGGGDSLTGEAGDDYLSGMAGADGIDGGDGRDRLLGGDGADTLRGGAGDDHLLGGAGNDTLDGGSGKDMMTGGEGLDFARYASSAAGLTIRLDFASLNTGDAAGDVYSGIEGLIGTGFFDFMIGDGGANTIFAGGAFDFVAGLAGQDTLHGEDGDDTLDGGVGNDTLSGGAGADNLIGGGGFDTASYASAAAGIVARLDLPSLNLNDAAGDSYTGISGLTGTGFSDLLVGTTGSQTLQGGAGIDQLIGRAGADTYFGGADLDFFVLSAGDFEVGVWDVIKDMNVGGAADWFTTTGLDRFSIMAVNYQGGVAVTTTGLGFGASGGGVFIENFTAAQFYNQLLTY